MTPRIAPPSATPPPMSPLMPCLAMKSRPRGVALSIGGLIEQRRTERVDLARVVAASDAEAHAAAGERVDHREVLGEAQRVPHRGDVEAAAHLEPLGLMREVERHHQ